MLCMHLCVSGFVFLRRCISKCKFIKNFLQLSVFFSSVPLSTFSVGQTTFLRWFNLCLLNFRDSWITSELQPTLLLRSKSTKKSKEEFRYVWAKTTKREREKKLSRQSALICSPALLSSEDWAKIRISLQAKHITQCCQHFPPVNCTKSAATQSTFAI